MNNTRLKLFPSILMLVAGSITSIMTYYFQYEIKAALLILLSVLLVFYVIGLVVIKVIGNFDKKNAEEIAAREAKEAEERLKEEMNDLQEEERTESAEV